MLNLGLGLGITLGGIVTNYSNYAITYRNRVIANGGTISDRDLSYLDTYIFGPLNTSGDLAELDRLGVFAVSSSIAARQDLIANVLCNPVNSPTFTAERGFTGDGVSAYIDTLFNIGNTGFSGTKYTRNSASYGTIHTAAAGANSQRWIGATFNNEIVLPAGSGFGSGCNSISSSNTTAAWTNSARGMKSARRVLSTEFDRYIDGVLSANIPANNSSAIPLASVATRTVKLLAWDNGGVVIAFNSGRISGWFAGSGNVNHANVWSAIENYLTAVGA